MSHCSISVTGIATTSTGFAVLFRTKTGVRPGSLGKLPRYWKRTRPTYVQWGSHIRVWDRWCTLLLHGCSKTSATYQARCCNKHPSVLILVWITPINSRFCLVSEIQAGNCQLLSKCGALTGWPQSERKNSLSFPGFSRAINLLFHRLSQQKINVIMTFIKVRVATSWGPNDPVYPVNSCFTQIFEWRTKNTLFVTIFPEVAQNFWEFPEFSMFKEIPDYSRFSRFVAILID